MLSAGRKKSHRAHHGNVSPPRVRIALSSYLISAAADNRPTELNVQTWEGFQLNFWVKGYYTDWSAPLVPLPLFSRSSIPSLRPHCAFIKISNYFQLQAGCCHRGSPEAISLGEKVDDLQINSYLVDTVAYLAVNTKGFMSIALWAIKKICKKKKKKGIKILYTHLEKSGGFFLCLW